MTTTRSPVTYGDLRPRHSRSSQELDSLDNLRVMIRESGVLCDNSQMLALPVLSLLCCVNYTAVPGLFLYTDLSLPCCVNYTAVPGLFAFADLSLLCCVYYTTDLSLFVITDQFLVGKEVYNSLGIKDRPTEEDSTEEQQLPDRLEEDNLDHFLGEGG